MIEQAKEELQILELEHPDRFEYLKLDLKSFILLESQKLLSTKADVTPSDSIVSLPTSSTATTQGQLQKPISPLSSSSSSSYLLIYIFKL